jgi:hypothetical protein
MTAAPPSSLASNATTVAGTTTPKCARREGIALLCEQTGELFPVRCRANFCEACGPANARLIGGAVTLASPERWGMLTQVGDDWPTIRNRMKDLRYDLGRVLREPFHWCWHCEPNPAGTGHHVHYWQRGPYVAQREFARLADGAGLGRVATIQRWRPSTRATVYGASSSLACATG